MNQILHTGLDIRKNIATAALTECTRALQKNKITNRGELMEKMSLDHITLGLHAWFVEKNLAGLKQHFYLSGKLNLASLDLPQQDAEKKKARFLSALFSDHGEIIQRFAALESRPLYKGKPQANRLPHHAHLLQLALRAEHRELDRQLAMVGEHCVERSSVSEHEILPGPDFYVRLLQRDRSALEALILSHANQREAALVKRRRPESTLIGHYMASSALKVKLCWMKGIPVEVDHRLVPMPLMPVSPLSTYEEPYAFMSQKSGVLHWVKRMGGLMRASA
jgi:hypothetical protein